MTHVMTSSEGSETRGHRHCWPRIGQEKDTNSASCHSPLRCFFLYLCSMSDSSITVHEHPYAAAYRGGDDPAPCTSSCPSHHVDFTSSFMYLSFQWLKRPHRGLVSQYRGQSLTFKTRLAHNFPFLSFMLILKRIFLYNQKLFLRGQPHFNRMFLFSCWCLAIVEMM